MNLIEDLEYRGFIHTMLGGTKEMLLSKPCKFYLGIDPTSPVTEGNVRYGIHIGHLSAIVAAKLLQKYGHQPYILLGKFTCCCGDPSGKTTERPLITMEQINTNCEVITEQLHSLLDFDSESPNKAVMVNNYDWFGKMNLLDFARNVTKYFSVNAMIQKESVQQRINREGCGISLLEFIYSPLQSYDFLHLYENMGVTIEIGGSDQWGNITSGVELIRKKLGKTDVGAFVFPLVTRADGTKFGKSADGLTVWLNPERTSPYEFFQFWLNQSDDDAKNLIKRFTLLEKDEIEALIAEHDKAPHLRVLQKALAKEVTVMVHGEEAYNKAIESANVIFGNGTSEDLKKMSARDIHDVFCGVPQFTAPKELLTKPEGVKLIDFCVENAKAFKSKGEMRKLIQNGGIFLNKERVTDVNSTVNTSNLIAEKYLILRQGKKNYSLIIAE